MGSLWLSAYFYPWELLVASEKYIGEGRWGMAATVDTCSVCRSISDLQGSSESITEEKSQEKLPAGLNLMPRIRSHLKNLSRNWEKVQ